MSDTKADHASAPPPRRRGAPAKGEPGARERILATASRLFYAQGMRAVGVDLVVEQAGVSKTTLYRVFPAKDDLITAVLARWNALFWTWWDRIEAEQADDPRAMLVALLEGVADRIAEATYRGCPFLNFAAEFPAGRHPGGEVAQANKIELRRRLAAILDRLGAQDPDRGAGQFLLLINGAYATGLLLGGEDLKSDLVAIASRLVA